MQYYSYLIEIVKTLSSINHLSIKKTCQKSKLNWTNVLKTDTLFVVNYLLCQIHNKTNDEIAQLHVSEIRNSLWSVSSEWSKADRRTHSCRWTNPSGSKAIKDGGKWSGTKRCRQSGAGCYDDMSALSQQRVSLHPPPPPNLNTIDRPRGNPGFLPPWRSSIWYRGI